MARAPSSTTTRERVNSDMGVSELKKTRCSGRSVAAPAATWITAPSPIRAVFSATAASSTATTLPICGVKESLPASACAMERMLSPFSRPARSESSQTKAPLTKTMRRLSTSPMTLPAVLARALSAASGGGANGLASRISARKSVYFHSSTRLCGRPCASKRLKASSCNAATVPFPGSLFLTAAKVLASPNSAAVFTGLTSTFIANLFPCHSGTARGAGPGIQKQIRSLRLESRLAASRRRGMTNRRASHHLVLVFGIAARFQFQRQIFAAALHHAAFRQHMHHIRHDVIEQPLVVGDDDHRSLRRAQAIDAVGDHAQRIDIEAGIGLVQHRQARLQQCHLQHLVALLFTAGKTDIHRAAQHLLVDAEPASHLAHAFEKFRRGQLRLAAPLALCIERGAQESHRRDAGNFQGILKGEKNALGGALVRLHGQ